jgi:hypothetical protein
LISSPGHYWCAEFTLTARGVGASVPIAFEAKAFLDVIGNNNFGTPAMGAVSPTTATLASTTTTNTIDITAQWNNSSAADVINTVVNTAYYLN